MDKKDVSWSDNPSTSIEALEQYITEKNIIGFVFNEYSVGEIEFWQDGELGHALTIWNGREGGVNGMVVSDMDDKKSTIEWYVEEPSGEINLLIKSHDYYQPPQGEAGAMEREYTLSPLYFK